MRVLQSFVALTALLVTIVPVNVAAQCRTFTVRKELNDMTAQDWAVYKSTILKAHATPDPNGSGYSIWEYGAILHNQVANVIHGNCQFLFWHRMFTRWMEQRLQAINPAFQFFYWDAAREWRNPTASTIFNHFGTSGRPVRDGFLANAYFKSTRSYLTRNFRFPDLGGILPSLETLTQLQVDSGRQGGFGFYASRMELFHGQLHVLLGGPGESGQIQSMFSPVDPFFYSHHSNVDWLWLNAQASWINQGRGPEYQIGGLDDRNMTCTLNNRLAGFQSVFADVIDLRRMCVRYLLPGQSAGAQPGGVVPGGVVPGGVVPGGVIPGGLPPGGGLPEQRRSLVPVPSGGTVSLNSAAISPNSIGGGAPYGEQLVPYQFPSGYRKMDQCPQALPPVVAGSQL
ncbi:hypothetical protein BASA60_010591 [Batrachochytrium salamandrivorans]|nr:hypothetical protein BASA60_010591 [Batrachochytrium salamandrivorans]